MTVFDANGRPAGEADWTWAAAAMFQWLDDERCRLTIIGRRVFGGPDKVAMIGTVLHGVVCGVRPIPNVEIRKLMLRMLRDRVVRIAIARVTLMNERAVRQEWERAFRAHLETPIERRGELDPEPPVARDRRAVMKELQELRAELESVVPSEAVIARPFGA